MEKCIHARKSGTEFLAYIESKQGDRDKHRGLLANMQAAIREFEKRLALLYK